MEAHLIPDSSAAPKASAATAGEAADSVVVEKKNAA